MLGVTGRRAAYISFLPTFCEKEIPPLDQNTCFFKVLGTFFFVRGCSKYIYVGTFPLKLSQVLDLFTKQRIFLLINRGEEACGCGG